MRRIPIHLLFALAGLLLISASVLTILAADPQQTANPIVPTAAAMLTQMPPEAVLAQLAAMGYTISPEMQATALAMLQQMPPEAVFELLLANAANPGGQPPSELPMATPVIVEATVVSPTEVLPIQPTLEFTPPPMLEPTQPEPLNTEQPIAELTAQVIPEQTQPPAAELTAEVAPEQTQPPVAELTAEVVPGVMAAPPQPSRVDMNQPGIVANGQQSLIEQQVTPVLNGPPGHQPPAQPGQAVSLPEATAEFSLPAEIPAVEATVMPTSEPLQSPVPVGRISGSVLRANLADAGGTTLLLTRPDGTTLNVPTSADGSFAFSNMEPGTYSLQASAAGYLSGHTTFLLEAGQDLALPTVTLTGGDTNGDNAIDLADAALLAANFNAPPPVPEADLNRDGWIDVHDLALLGNAFGLTGPQPWG